MQTKYTQFRPDLKGVKVIKSYFFENTYHINSKRYGSIIFEGVKK